MAGDCTVACGIRTPVLVLVLALAGCGDADPPTTAPTPTAPPLALNGAYSGDGGSFLGIGRMRWVLSQSGNAVTGPVTVTDAQGAITARGTLVGTLRESTLSFTITMPPGGLSALPLCSASIEGIADVTPSTIRGVYSGTATCSTSFFGQFALTKE